MSLRGRVQVSLNQQYESENQVLVAAGFAPSGQEDDDLWSKDGVWFGRNAALQSARQTLRTQAPAETLPKRKCFKPTREYFA